MLRYFLFFLALIGWLSALAFASLQTDLESHPVRFLVRSSVAKDAAQIVCIRAPEKGLSQEQWMRSVDDATRIRTTVPLGEESEVRLPAGGWWVWAEHAQCSHSNKRIIVVPRSKPSHAVAFWLDDHVGVSGKVVDEQGRGALLATVCLKRWDSVRTISVGLDGSFEDPAVKPGAYSVSVTSTGNVEMKPRVLHVPVGCEAAKWVLVVTQEAKAPIEPTPSWGSFEFAGLGQYPVEGVLVESGQPLERSDVAGLFDLYPHFDGNSLDLLYWGEDARKAGQLKLPWHWPYASECEWNEDASFKATVTLPGSYLVRRIRKVRGGGSKGFQIGNHYKRRFVVGSAWLVQVEAGEFEGLQWTVPPGQVHVRLMGEHGNVLRASQVIDGPNLQLLGEELWSEPIRPTATWTDFVVFEGLPPGRYTLSGVQKVLGSEAEPGELIIPMQSVAVMVEHGRVDLDVPMFPATTLKGRVVNPSRSLDGRLHPRLGVYAWKDADRTQLVAATSLDRSAGFFQSDSAGFAFRGLPRKPISMSVESFPQSLGYRGPVIRVDLTDGAPEDFEILVP
ncbi:MAG: hypothetical protein ACI9X4_002149 [Glaciecola sp.]|jgi:hypothetical protein